MLKIVMLLLCLSAIAIADQYDTKYDDIDLDEILNSERLLNNYINCLLNMGPCTPDGQQLKGMWRKAYTKKTIFNVRP